MLTMMGLFVPAMRELNEMAYQYDRECDFNSSKFNERIIEEKKSGSGSITIPIPTPKKKTRLKTRRSRRFRLAPPSPELKR